MLYHDISSYAIENVHSIRMIKIWSFMIIPIEATNPQVWTLESWLGNTGEIGVLFGLIQLFPLPQQDDGRRKSLIRSAFLLRFFSQDFDFLIPSPGFSRYWVHLRQGALPDFSSPSWLWHLCPSSLLPTPLGWSTCLLCWRLGNLHSRVDLNLGFGIRGEGSGGWI